MQQQANCVTVRLHLATKINYFLVENDQSVQIVRPHGVMSRMSFRSNQIPHVVREKYIYF